MTNCLVIGDGNRDAAELMFMHLRAMGPRLIAAAGAIQNHGPVPVSDIHEMRRQLLHIHEELGNDIARLDTMLRSGPYYEATKEQLQFQQTLRKPPPAPTPLPSEPPF